MFKLLSKEIILRYQNGRDVVPGFATYIDKHNPVLMHCYGWQDYSDAYDNYMITISRDNGKSWSEPYVKWKGVKVPEGLVRYGEPAAFFDTDTGKLITLTNRSLYPKDSLDVGRKNDLVMQTYTPFNNSWSEEKSLELSSHMSFSFPLKISSGRIIFPGQNWYLDEQGKPYHYKGCWCPAGVITNMLGDYKADGSIEWKLSKPLIPDLDRTSRGFYEAAIAELRNGTLVMILRGDNSMFPEKPGYKWMSFSEDRGETWSEAEPLSFINGDMIESGSNGSTLFRSIKTGDLYWMGNLCIYGERPKGNYPRTSLVIAKMQEEPFGLIRDSIFVIDEKGFNDSSGLQLSNFRYHQDRLTGDVILYLTRIGERDKKNWQDADYYKYRIELQ
ncbi:MAG TPA: hypothetical protein DDZ89_09265 [Clostridiales bacterium]|nr:hypothetical protein [Clostridiales bacterium]